MSKDFTSFLYFTLEANENLCFYSTLPFEKAQAHRDIVVYCTPELKDPFDKVIKHLMKRAKITVLSEQLVLDED